MQNETALFRASAAKKYIIDALSMSAVGVDLKAELK